ncbi:MAG TPA: hypothetical protein VHN99_03705 [Deinococcales bacterium]|nr:hypothetical protein [Deinococcales bacterium]
MNAVNWPRLAVRLVLAYLALTCGLALARWATRHTLPELQDLQDREAALRYRQSQLTLDIERLESAARVRAWASANGFEPYVTTHHEFAALPPLPPLPVKPLPVRALKVVTIWR